MSQQDDFTANLSDRTGATCHSETEEREVYSKMFLSKRSKWKDHPWSGRRIILMYWSTMTLLLQGWLSLWPVLIVSPWLNCCIMFLFPGSSGALFETCCKFLWSPWQHTVGQRQDDVLAALPEGWANVRWTLAIPRGIAAELKRNRVCLEKVLLF